MCLNLYKSRGPLDQPETSSEVAARDGASVCLSEDQFVKTADESQSLSVSAQCTKKKAKALLFWKKEEAYN